VPPALCEQLSPEGGRLVIPVGELGQPQSLMRLVKNGDRVDTQDLGAFSFVPLLSGVGWGQEGF
jgi:protein-L-isoaspartate(D-aspartate) O-methyltransferase